MSADVKELTAVLELAHIAAQIYEPNGCVSAPGFVVQHNLPANQGRFAIIDREHDTVIVFRGTDNAENANDDRKFLFPHVDPITKACVHRGFLEYTEEAWAVLLTLNLARGRQYVLTGHSLGAGVAVLIAARLRVCGYDVRAVTFGQPKVTNGYDGGAMERRFDVLRVVNDHDPVPTVPLTFGVTGVMAAAFFVWDAFKRGRVEGFHPKNWFTMWRYYHFGRLLHLKPDGEAEEASKRKAKYDASGGFYHNLWRLATDATDHKMLNYIAAITTALARASAQAAEPPPSTPSP